MVEFRGGRLPADPSKPRLRLSPYLTSTAPPPASVDWYSRAGAWPMLGNDRVGDCTEAMVAHVVQGTSTYGDGVTALIPEVDVLAAYSRVSGYDPDDPSTDRGALLQDVYNDWVRHGVGGHKALAFGELDHGDLNEIKTGVNVFGAVGLGIAVTQEMMDDFNAGQPWDRPGRQQLGGHAVPIVGYDADNVYVVTWAQIQPMTWDCFREVTDEAWSAIVPEWINDTSGLDPLGVDLHGLGEALAQLTGTNPFPVPEPTPPSPPVPPTPDPVPPEPVPPVDDADRRLAHVAHRYLRHMVSRGDLRSALVTWLTSKDL